MMKMNNNGTIVLQAEALQLSVYCKIIKDILIKYRNMSIIKLIVFSFIIKKHESLQVECFSSKNSTDLVLKALTQIAGRYDELTSQLPYIFQAIDLLIKNGICDLHTTEVMCLLPESATHQLMKGFIYSAIEESKSYTDRQFLKEVISIV